MSDFINKENCSDLKEFYIPYRKTLDLPDNVTFGLEVEFKMDPFNDSYKSNFIDEDNAARVFMKDIGYDYNYDVECEINNHIELVSPVLTDNDKTWEELDNILTFIKNNDGYYSGKCGAHIHVGKNILNSNSAWLNFFKLWYVFEDDIFRFTNGENYRLRENGDYKAAKIANACKNIIKDYNTFKDIDISYLSSNKLVAVNFPSPLKCEDFSNLLKTNSDPKANNILNTVEFRSPNGTINPVIWQNNVNFFTKFMLSCANKNLDTEKLDYLYNSKSYATVDDLAYFVFKDEFDKKCFLRQYYKDFDNPDFKIRGTKSKPFWK